MKTELYERHLALLERCLTGSIYPEEFAKIQFRRGSWQRAVFGPIQKLLDVNGYLLFRQMHPTEEDREGGFYRPGQGQTMIGLKRLRNVRESLESVLHDNIPGDIVETGVWRGGGCIYMKSILECEGSDKLLWVCDSFQGVPKPNADKYPDDAIEERNEAFYKFDQLAVSLEEVRESFCLYGVLDDRVHFLKG